jgi:hypothetical protein
MQDFLKFVLTLALPLGLASPLSRSLAQPCELVCALSSCSLFGHYLAQAEAMPARPNNVGIGAA